MHSSIAFAERNGPSSRSLGVARDDRLDGAGIERADFRGIVIAPDRVLREAPVGTEIESEMVVVGHVAGKDPIERWAGQIKDMDGAVLGAHRDVIVRGREGRPPGDARHAQRSQGRPAQNGRDGPDQQKAQHRPG